MQMLGGLAAGQAMKSAAPGPTATGGTGPAIPPAIPAQQGFDLNPFLQAFWGMPAAGSGPIQYPTPIALPGQTPAAAPRPRAGTPGQTFIQRFGASRLPTGGGRK